MNIKNVLSLEKKKSNLEEFLNFAFDQPIPYQFRSLSYLPVDHTKISSDVALYQCENDNLFFILEYKNSPTLIYEINLNDNSINDVKCLNKKEFQNLIKCFAENIKLSDIPT